MGSTVFMCVCTVQWYADYAGMGANSSLPDGLRAQVALKCADLGHLSSPRDVHMKWVRLLEEEFFRQGDSEKASGLSVSPLMDREKNGITMSQVSLLKGCKFAHCKGMEVHTSKALLNGMCIAGRLLRHCRAASVPKLCASLRRRHAAAGGRQGQLQHVAGPDGCGDRERGCGSREPR